MFSKHNSRVLIYISSQQTGHVFYHQFNWCISNVILVGYQTLWNKGTLTHTFTLFFFVKHINQNLNVCIIYMPAICHK